METQSRITRSKVRIPLGNNENSSIQLKCAPKVKVKSTVLGNLTNNSFRKSLVMAPTKKPNSVSLNPSKQSKAGKSSKENVNPPSVSSSTVGSTEKRTTRKSLKENAIPKDQNVSELNHFKNNSNNKSSVLTRQKKLNIPAKNSISNTIKQTKTRKVSKENATPAVANNSVVADNSLNDSANKSSTQTQKTKLKTPVLSSISCLKQIRTRKASRGNVTPEIQNNSVVTDNSVNDSANKSSIQTQKRKLNTPYLNSVSSSKPIRTRKSSRGDAIPKIQNNSIVADNSITNSVNKSPAQARKRKLSTTSASNNNAFKQSRTGKVIKENVFSKFQDNLNVLEKSTNDSATNSPRTRLNISELSSSSTKKTRGKKNTATAMSSLRKLQAETSQNMDGEDVYDFVFDADKEPKPAKKKRIRKKKRESVYKPKIKIPPVYKDYSKTAALAQFETQPSKRQVLKPSSANDVNTGNLITENPVLQSIQSEDSNIEHPTEQLKPCSTKKTVNKELIAKTPVLQLTTTEIDDCNFGYEPLHSPIMDTSSGGLQENIPPTLTKENQETEIGEEMSMDNCFGFYTSSQEEEFPAQHVASTPMKVLASTAACRNVSISPVRKVLGLKNLPSRPARIDSQVVRDLVCIPAALKNSMKQSLLEHFIQPVETESPQIENPPPTPPSAFSKVN